MLSGRTEGNRPKSSFMALENVQEIESLEFYNWLTRPIAKFAKPRMKIYIYRPYLNGTSLFPGMNIEYIIQCNTPKPQG